MWVNVSTKTVGVTVSDPFGWTAQDWKLWGDEANEEFGIIRLGEIITEYELKIVIGLPKIWMELWAT